MSGDVQRRLVEASAAGTRRSAPAVADLVDALPADAGRLGDVHDAQDTDEQERI